MKSTGPSAASNNAHTAASAAVAMAVPCANAGKADWTVHCMTLGNTVAGAVNSKCRNDASEPFLAAATPAGVERSMVPPSTAVRPATVCPVCISDRVAARLVPVTAREATVVAVVALRPAVAARPPTVAARPARRILNAATPIATSNPAQATSVTPIADPCLYLLSRLRMPLVKKLAAASVMRLVWTRPASSSTGL